MPDESPDMMRCSWIKRLAAAALLAGALAGGLRAQTTLLYLELQAAGAYSTASGRFELFSLAAEEVMQKPSLGFDLVQRFSGRSRDIGVLAVQARLAYDEEGEHKLQPQLYNAYFRLKTGFANIWAGHNRPALGHVGRPRQPRPAPARPGHARLRLRPGLGRRARKGLRLGRRRRFADHGQRHAALSQGQLPGRRPRFPGRPGPRQLQRRHVPGPRELSSTRWAIRSSIPSRSAGPL